MGGLPCIRDLRFPVASVVTMVADGMSFEEIVGVHPDLELEDIKEALHYAAVPERELPLRTSARGPCSTRTSHHWLAQRRSLSLMTAPT
jgi:uncharacterized protein (DUF433 family)